MCKITFYISNYHQYSYNQHSYWQHPLSKPRRAYKCTAFFYSFLTMRYKHISAFYTMDHQRSLDKARQPITADQLYGGLLRPANKPDYSITDRLPPFTAVRWARELLPLVIQLYYTQGPNGHYFVLLLLPHLIFDRWLVNFWTRQYFSRFEDVYLKLTI